MKVEIIGLTGAGKTHFVKEQENAGYFVDALVISRNVRYSSAFKFFVSNPVFSSRLLWLLIKNLPLDLRIIKHKIFYIYLRALAKEHIFRNNDNIILEDGILQLLFSIFESRINKYKVEKELRWFNLPQRNVLWLDTPLSIRKKNMRQRGRYLRNHYEKNARDAFFATFEKNSEYIKMYIDKNYNVKSINLYNTKHRIDLIELFS